MTTGARMNKVGFALGVILLVGGIGAAAWAYAVIHHIPSPEYRDQYDYDFWSAVEILGLVNALVGGVFAVYSLVAEETVTLSNGRRTSIQQPLAPGAMNFCQYCGRQIALDAVWCPGCGRNFSH